MDMETYVSCKNKQVKQSTNIDCINCSLYRICLPKDAKEYELYALNKIIKRQQSLKRNVYLFKEGDPFTAIYAVKSGCVKTYRLAPNGKEQVCGFYLPGELIGLDAIESGKHTCSAKILQTSNACAIPYTEFEKLSKNMPGLQHQLLRLMSKEISTQQWLVTLLGKHSADERVAAILCNLSDRFETRGYSPVEFNLGMSRHDLGDYLGLAIETISRVLGRFHQAGLLTASGKNIQLHQPKQLRELAGYS